ncbi:hypothetical protein AZE42_04256 [Rhizopogon vesiculosus]|uniref:Uncharacterized protein n=1 Tax=Rhizopogon vesiculosus TaxID=180088 RepID=A0A1J8QAX7_9AGAM|nr:hypothetical protein AZE42_04256 [Rhizopogon vesiculosus]
MIVMAGNIQLIEAASMAAVDIVLRRSSRIAQHPQHPYTHIPKRRQHIDQDLDADDQLTPRALRALKRQRLTLDSDGLPLPQLESPHRRKRRKENDILTTGPLKEVRRRVRHIRIRTRPQNLSKPRHITPSQPILDIRQPTNLAPKDDDPQDAPTQTTPPPSPSPVPHYRPPSPVQMNPPPIDSPSIHVTLHSPTDVIQSRSHSPPPLPQPQSEPNSPTQVQSNSQPSHSHPLPLHQLPDLDSLIPLDPLPEFLPHDTPYSDSPNFQSNASFSSVPVHEFPSNGDMNFVSNAHPFSSPQGSVFSSPGAFGSNHAFPSNPGSFSNSFGPHSHEFIPAHSHSHSDFSPPQDNSFSNTDGFPSPSSNGFTSPSNGFHPQSNDYTQSNGYSQSNGYTQQGAFSQPNHLTYDYAPVAHRDREVNIWKLASSPHRLHRYGIDTIKALVASQARVRYQSSPDDDFSSNHSSNTRFRLYTPASYIERASYTYKSAELDGMDFDMDDDEDYDDDDDDDEDCDFGCDVDDYGYDDEGDEEDMFPMDMELMEGGKSKVVVVKSPGRDRDMPKRSESLETKTNSSMLPNPIVPPTVPPIPQSISMSSPSDSIPIPQIPEPGAGSGSPTAGVHSSSTDVDSSPRTPSIPQPTSPPPSSTPPGSTPGTTSPPSIPHTPTSPSTPGTSPPSSPTPIPTPPLQTPTVSTTQTSTTLTPQMPQTPTPAPGPPSLLRTPPLSSLHVTLLSEPPRAFMGRGTPPDRRRLSEWGRWGCIRAMGLRGDMQHPMAMTAAMCGNSMALREDVQQQPGEDVPLQHGERMAGEHASTEQTSAQHGEAQQQHLEHSEHPPAQHVVTHHDEHSHPPPQHDHDHSEHLETHGEWTSFLFAMLEGDAGGNSAGWYELGAGVSASPSVSTPGEPTVGMGTLGSSQGMTTLNIPQSMSVPQTVGEADSTLRFALG